MSDKYFCSKCGAEMRADMNFCPECGAVVAGSDMEKKKIKDEMIVVRESTFMWIKFMLIIYTIPVIIVGIVNIVNAGNNADVLWANADFREMAIKAGITLEALKSSLLTSGILATISGVSAGATLYLVSIRKYWLIAFILCIVASILSVWNIIGLFVGLFVAWMIYDVKPAFDQPVSSENQFA